MLVVDASVAVAAAFAPAGFVQFAGEALAAPALMWSEARSVLRLGLWRGLVEEGDAALALDHLEDAPIERVHHEQLGREAWSIAAELGWACTYDAEYLALARLLDCRVVTVDARLLRGTRRLGFVVAPSDL